MSELDFRTKLNQCVTQIEKIGTEYASAKALSWQLQELRKVVLAEEMLKTQGNTIQERESKARVSETYRGHLLGTKEAIEKEHILKVQMDRWNAQFEAIRSLMSLEKEKMKTFQE